MAITWNHLHGATSGNAMQAPAIGAFYEALFNASPSFATTTGFVMQEGTSKIVFEGSFSVTPFFPPAVTGGTIKGFAVYVGDMKMIEVSGYGLDYQTLMDGLAAAKAGTPSDVEELFDLIYPGPMTVNGSDDADYLAGSDFADVVHGGGASDAVASGGGDDGVFGEDGNDSIEAGAGDDYISGGDGNDSLRGGDGSDTADYSEKGEAVAVTLAGPDIANVTVGGVVEDTVSGIENLIGGSGNDIFRGDGLNNRLDGGIGDDTLDGSGGNDVLLGGEGADTIAGDIGNDEIHGGTGRDLLTGGDGSDQFVFDTGLGKKGGKTNADKIADFASGFDDIVLDGDVFRKLDDGPLKAKHFAEGSPGDGNDYLVFRKGKLFYDKDGDGDAAMKLIAKLGDAKLHADDILIG